MEVEGRFADVETLMRRPSPFGNETGELPMGEFAPGQETIDFVRSEAAILVIGAGGLGCELLKDLALSGFTNIHVIDLDSIDLSNLNRQFLFRHADIGQSKAEVAARFINERVPGCTVTPHHGKIQDFDADFYAQFNCVVSGLDNVEARRWLNSMIVGLVDTDEDGDIVPDTVIPLIDGGTEGFGGQARVIVPKITSCFECSIDTFPPQQNFQLCTIAETPRNPQHCVAYAMMIQWPAEFPGRKYDTDSPEDMMWICEHAQERAAEHGIEGVDYNLTLGVVKRIIPAIASTNAAMSAACVNEVFKVLSYCSQTLNTYLMYMGAQGVYAHSFCYAVREGCPVCGGHEQSIEVPPTTTLAELREMLKEGDLRLKDPSLSGNDQTLFVTGPPSLRRAVEANLDKPLSELFPSETVLVVSDPVFVGDVGLQLQVTFV